MSHKQRDESSMGASKKGRPSSSALPIEHKQGEAKKITVKTIDVLFCPECKLPHNPHNRVILQVFAAAEGEWAK